MAQLTDTAPPPPSPSPPREEVYCNKNPIPWARAPSQKMIGAPSHPKHPPPVPHAKPTAFAPLNVGKMGGGSQLGAIPNPIPRPKRSGRWTPPEYPP